MKFDDPRIQAIIADCHLNLCLECGKCSSSCPRMLSGKEYSPRLLAHKLINQPGDEAYIENSVWECLTCGLCGERCPSGVNFSRFISEMRALLASEKGLKGYRSHDGALHSWWRMMASPDLKQNRLDWITPDLKVKTAGPLAFFTGCAPYFDVFFAGIAVDTLAIARDSIRLLNFLDLEPAVLPNERCCGHDFLWNGDVRNFEALCRLNHQEFIEAGVERIVVSCPECYTVLHDYMPRVVPGFNLEVTLLMDLVAAEMHRGGKAFRPLARAATYHDPCRLARISGHVDQPRTLLQMVPELELREMPNNRRGAICCGANGFINCDAYTKIIQVERLKEAKATKADLLVTACPKCMIHFTCAMRDPLRRGEIALEIKDLVSVLADRIALSDDPAPVARKK